MLSLVLSVSSSHHRLEIFQAAYICFELHTIILLMRVCDNCLHGIHTGLSAGCTAPNMKTQSAQNANTSSELKLKQL